ncbi:AI-2E family transporter [soil metagenome]
MTEITKPEQVIIESEHKPRTKRRDFIQKVLIIIFFAVILAVVWQGVDVILLIFAGGLLAVFFRTLSETLSKYTPLSHGLALTVVLLLIVGLIVLGGWFLAPSVQTEFTDLTNQLPADYEKAQRQLSGYPLGRKIVEKMPTAQQFIFEVKSTNVFSRVTGMFSTVFSVIANILIILMTAVYFAFSANTYKEGILKLVPNKREQRAREILSVIHYTLKSFLVGISGSMTINGILTFLGLWFLGIPFAIPLAIIAGLMSFIPNIGPLIAAAPAVLIALSQSPTQALYVLIIYLAVQNLDGFIVTPLIQKRAVAIPPVLIIASQLMLAVIFGFLGLLLAVPLVAIVFVMVRMIYVEDILGRKVEVNGEPKAKKEVVSEVTNNE